MLYTLHKVIEDFSECRLTPDVINDDLIDYLHVGDYVIFMCKDIDTNFCKVLTKFGICWIRRKKLSHYAFM